MQDDLKNRLTTIRPEMDTAEGARAEELLDQLEQIAMSLEADGAPVPGWVKARIASRVDEAVEDMFDNMPV